MSGGGVRVSRLTFREKCPTVCWQKQLRDKYLAEGVPPVPYLDVKRAIVRPVTRKLAEQIILKYEWLGTMATGVNRFYGIFYGNYCAGVTSFAPAGFNLPSLAKSFRVDGSQLAYLGRGANVHWAPKGSNSKLIAYSLKLESQLGNKLAIAFSDSDAGEIGTVYQASNWVYVGQNDVAWKQWVSPDGKTWSYNQFTKWYKENGLDRPRGIKVLSDKGWKLQDSNPKHRYVYILDKTDKALVDRVERMRQPYPKRPASIDSDAPAIQAGDGGANPTAGLDSRNTANV